MRFYRGAKEAELIGCGILELLGLLGCEIDEKGRILAIGLRGRFLTLDDRRYELLDLVEGGRTKVDPGGTCSADRT